MAGFSTFSITPYTGEWGPVQAAHLLRRTMFGPQPEDIDQAVSMGLNETIQTLVFPHPMPEPPINYNFEDDPNAPIGSTWVNQPYVRIDNANQLVNSRLRSHGAWTLGLCLNEGMSIREKMTLFWHNHYVTSEIRDANFAYNNISLYRQQYLGNFRQLTKATTIDSAMLRYLNGNQNTNFKPNENYARELLELFTIGKGPIAGEGDYTNYTEADVAAAAKILTGWRDTGYFSRDGLEPGSIFRTFAHDNSTKQLSHRFGNVEISNMGDKEYASLIDMIFQQDEVANFITRKIYRWFVYYEIDDQVEEGVIQPLAQILRDNDFDMAPMVEALLASEHFYDDYAIGSMIKSPLDYIAGQIKNLKIDLGNNEQQQYRMWFRLLNFAELLQQGYFSHPDVAGWKAYYQEPLYYRTWINSTTISSRFLFTNLVLSGVRVDRLMLQANLLEVVATIDQAEDPNTLIETLVQAWLPKDIAPEQKDYLKSLLLPGLPDYEWTIEYNDYLADPENEELKMAVENRLKSMVLGLLSLPEYQLS